MFYRVVHHHTAQMLMAVSLVTVYCLVSEILMHVGFTFPQATETAYGFLPVITMLVALKRKDFDSLKAAILLGLLWSVNTLIFYKAPVIVFHTIIFQIASVAILVKLGRPMVAAFSAPMVAVGMLMFFGLNQRIVLTMLAFSQCLVLGMQAVPVKDAVIRKVAEVNDYSFKKAS